MLSDKCIIELVTAKIEGKRVFYSNEQDATQCLVEDDHKWDFENNEYMVHCLGHHVKCKKENKS